MPGQSTKLLLLTCLCAAHAFAAEKAEKPTGASPAASLASMQVVWTKSAMTGALDVSPHPVLSRRAILSRESGLMISEDWGKTFQPLPQATPQRVGLIRSLAFDPDQTDVFYAAGEKGIWLSTDNGKMFEQVGAKSRGMAADEVVGVWIYPGDPSNRTLLAAHGRAAPGLSVTYDGGAKWRVLYPHLFVSQLVVGLTTPEMTRERSCVLIAASKESPDIFRVYSCTVLGEEPVEQTRDLVPTEAASSVMTDPPESGWSDFRSVYLATSDAGLHVLSPIGGFVPARLETPGIVSWTGIGLTFGPLPDTQLFYGYDAAKLGLVMSLDGFKTFSSGSRGLPTGPFIREGAHLRASPGGGAYYATINGSLYLGTVWGPGMIITGVEVTPPVVSFSRDRYLKAHEEQWQQISMFVREPSAAAAAKRLRESFQKGRDAYRDAEFTVRTKVLGNSPPASVTVDLSAVDGPDAEPMFDDGQHGDGAAGDGVYGAQFRLNLSQSKNHRKRNHWPGLVGLPLTVTSSTGRVGAVAAVVAIRARSDDAVVWDEPHKPGKHAAEGGATAEVIDATTGIYSGREALGITVTGGPWSTSLHRQADVASLTAYASLDFWVKTEGNTRDDLLVQLRDEPQIGLSETTRPVPVLTGGYLKGGVWADDWRQVSIPIDRLLSEGGVFQPALFSHVIFSGEGKTTGTYWIDSIRLVRPEPAKGP
ncbi:MAG: hypothetical protein NTY19_46720 [Planctomycetota bacterium]|nr:hypothetical protein [Planctomycetota bacterium]